MDTLNPGYSTMANEKTPVFHLQRGSEELPWDAVWNGASWMALERLLELHGPCRMIKDSLNKVSSCFILIEEHHYRIPELYLLDNPLYRDAWNR